MVANEPLNDIRMIVTKRGARLFRNQVGSYDIVRRDGSTSHIVTGLCPGSSDLIGWAPIEITPAMVGKKIAIFLAVEVKNSQKPSKKQIDFINAVKHFGGIGIFSKTPEETAKTLEEEIEQITK